MKKIKIIKDGPYLVSGNVPLEELIITPTENGNEYKPGRTFEVESSYTLCRCGKSHNKPFCDGTHQHHKFNGDLTASKKTFNEQAEIYEGKNLILEDVSSLCAFARFCHSIKGDVWSLTELSTNEDTDSTAVKMACDCPAGRLVIRDKKTNQAIEPALEQSIAILQDPSRDCSGPLWIRGGIPIEDEEGYTYEIRNRVTLCRCGASINKPFCDARHIVTQFNDKN